MTSHGSARWAGLAHDLALAWMTGGIAGGSVSAVLLFRHAPSREVAGQVGNAIFEALGPIIFILTIVLLGARILLRVDALGGGRPLPSLWPCILACVLAGVLALWLTPTMVSAWSAAPHDPSGGGLMGEDKARFMRLHGAGNLIYLTLFVLGSALIAGRALRAAGSRGTRSG